MVDSSLSSRSPAASTRANRSSNPFNLSNMRRWNIRLRPGIDRFFNFMSTTAVSWGMWILGPMLVIFASGIIAGLTYAFFAVLSPMLDFPSNTEPSSSTFSLRRFLHSCIVVFLDVNIIFNYFMCVSTRNAGENHERVLRELASATGYNYPETETEIENSRREYEEKIGERRNARNNRGNDPSYIPATTTATSPSSTPENRPLVTHASPANNETSTDNNNGGLTNGARTDLRNRLIVRSATAVLTRRYGWTLLGPLEWGFCLKSYKPKPPRAHFDNVTQNLVLNMDHYCPWMFNTVGYFNYRYFVNFLLYVLSGMMYGAYMSFRPFQNISHPDYVKNIRLSRKNGFKTVQHLYPLVPTPDERSVVSLTFLLCVSVGFAVLCLLGLHIYLLLTAQTTIEMTSNGFKKRIARSRGISWINPYDLGMKRNWQQVYGTSHPLLALLPSGRQPEYLPVPIAGEKGWRHPKGYAYDSDEDVSMLV